MTNNLSPWSNLIIYVYFALLKIILKRQKSLSKSDFSKSGLKQKITPEKKDKCLFFKESEIKASDLIV